MRYYLPIFYVAHIFSDYVAETGEECNMRSSYGDSSLLNDGCYMIYRRRKGNEEHTVQIS